LLAAARQVHGDDGIFVESFGGTEPIDFVVASGLFNVRLNFEVAEWEEYMYSTLASMHAWSREGFAFNVLSSAVPEIRRRPDLYYPDENVLTKYCISNYSSRVLVYHDRETFDTTVYVLK
jgi:hypothetical protein